MFVIIVAGVLDQETEVELHGHLRMFRGDHADDPRVVYGGTEGLGVAVVERVRHDVLVQDEEVPHIQVCAEGVVYILLQGEQDAVLPYEFVGFDPYGDVGRSAAFLVVVEEVLRRLHEHFPDLLRLHT